MSLYEPGRPIEVKPFDTMRKKTVPHEKGEYRILDMSRNILYIGQAKDLARRMKDHIRTGKLNKNNGIFAFKVANEDASWKSLVNHERQKIKKHDPPLNKRAGGAGRPF